MNEYLNFKEMITPKIIKWVYILGAIGLTIASLFNIFTGEVLLGSLVLILGNVAFRMVCESTVVAFGIFGSLRNIEDHLVKKKR